MFVSRLASWYTYIAVVVRAIHCARNAKSTLKSIGTHVYQVEISIWGLCFHFRDAEICVLDHEHQIKVSL